MSQPPANEQHPATVPGADAASSETRFLRRSGIFWAAVPPLTLFILSTALTGTPLPSPLGNNLAAADIRQSGSASDWTVPASETIVVSNSSSGGFALLRGRLSLSDEGTVRAPTAGQVARIVASAGKQVQAGEPLVMISTGAVTPQQNLSPLERLQKQAEAAQVKAAREQEKLESSMSGSSERLQKAQARVVAAQKRVTEARTLIRRLKAGEVVRTSEATKATTPASATGNQPAKAAAARTAALRESQRLLKEAEAAETKAKETQRAASAAEAEIHRKRQKLQAAISAEKAAEKTAAAEASTSETDASDEEKPSNNNADDRAAKAKAVTVARQETARASSRAAELNRSAAAQRTRASELRNKARAAAEKSKAPLQNLQVFADAGNTGEKSAPAAAKSNSSGGTVSAADAARIARAAMKESRDAIADAERIRREVEGYSRPVTNTRKQTDTATRKLQAAEQKLWDVAGAARPNITTVPAPAAGVVLWVADLAREVPAGAPVARVGRPDRLEVTVHDTSGVWRSIKPDSRVMALVQRDSPPENPAVSTATGAPTAQPKGVSTMARVLEVKPPAKEGAPAVLRIAVHNPPQSGQQSEDGAAPRAFAPGMIVMFSLEKPGKRAAINIPTAAIRRDENGTPSVAVLSPVADAAAVGTDTLCRVEWRSVQVKNDGGVNSQVTTGLEPGDRIALRPDTLYDYTRAHGLNATVRVEKT